MPDPESPQLSVVTVRMALRLPADQADRLPTRDELGTARTLLARAAAARDTRCRFDEKDGWAVLTAWVEPDIADYLFDQLTQRLGRLLSARTLEVVMARFLTADHRSRAGGPDPSASR